MIRNRTRAQNNGSCVSPTHRRISVSRDVLFDLLVLLCLLPLSVSAEAEGVPDPAVDEPILEHRLDNGLRLVLCPDSSVTTLTVNATYLVGSRHEGPGQAGMAHMLEHMLINSTENIPSMRDSLVARGADYNGTTWFDRTQFHETLAGTAENLAFGLRLEAERMNRALLLEDDLAREMGVIANEFQLLENDHETILSQRMMATAYQWHNYGRATIGNLADIQSYPLEDLRRFYREHYRPDNAVITVAGRFDTRSALDLAERCFGSTPRPGPMTPTHTVEPPQEGPRRIVLSRVAEVARGAVMYHVPSGAHPDAAALDVLLEILTGPSTGRLRPALVETGRASEIKGVRDALTLAEPGVLEIRLETSSEGAITELVEEMAMLCEEVGDDITERDVERARARIQKRYRRLFSDLPRFAVELSEWIALGDWRSFFTHQNRVASLSGNDVRAVANRYLRPNNRTIGIIVPTDRADPVEIPPRPGASSSDEDLKFSMSVATGEPIDLSVETITNRTLRMTLDPGLTVVFFPKQTRGAMVSAVFHFRYGTPEAMYQKDQASRFLPDLLLRGTTRRGHEELQEQLDLLQSDLVLRGYKGVLSARLTSDREHLAKAIELLGEILREPRFDSHDFGVIKAERLAKLEAQVNDPVERCFNAIRRGLYTFPSTSPHYKPTLEEQVEELRNLTLGDVRDLYEGQLGARFGVAGIVGDFELAEAASAAARAFEGWESPAPYEAIDPPYQRVRATQRRIATPDKPMAIVGIATLFPMRDDDPAYPAMLLANYLLGGNPGARLPNRLREREALSYHAASVIQVEPEIHNANLFGYAFCAPERADTSLAVLREEITEWITGGLSEEEVLRGRGAYIREFELGLSQDPDVASELARLEEHERCYSFHGEVLERIRNLTAEEANDCLRRFLSDAEFVEVVAGDIESP